MQLKKTIKQKKRTEENQKKNVFEFLKTKTAKKLKIQKKS